MKTKRSLLDQTRSALPTHRGFLPWYEKISPELRAEAEAVKEEFLRGGLGTKSAVSLALANALSERGVKIGRNGVASWLDKKLS